LTEESPSIIARGRHAHLTLEQICDMMPGMARLMVEVSDRFWLCYYAAKAGNWDLARHQCTEMRKAMLMATITRPKYLESMTQYLDERVKPLQAAIQKKDWPAFEAAYAAATDAANELHRELGYEYIDWQLPEAPPPHLRLEPPSA
jgi:hypothetical protein